MSKPVSLFSGYSQSENRTTNYCLLIMKMIYEENPKFLAELLGALVSEDVGEHLGVRFRQQQRKNASTPDGLIVQRGFTIYIEAKHFDWFYDAQLESHLAALNDESSGLKALIVLANFEATSPNKFDRVQRLCQELYKDSIVFKDISFEALIDVLQRLPLPKNLADAVADFRAYLDEEDLLPSWKRRLDVVNCAGLPDDVLVGNAYMCPATGGSYNHARCMYFGMYRERCVESVAVIEAVVDVEGKGKATIKWQNVLRPEDEVKALAQEKAAKLRPLERPLRVFLLGRLYPTDFRKDSPYGMQASKQYFDIAHLAVKGAEELAKELSGKNWSQLRRETSP